VKYSFLKVAVFLVAAFNTSRNSANYDPAKGTFTDVKCDFDESLMHTTIFGLIKMDVSKMTPVESPG